MQQNKKGDFQIKKKIRLFTESTNFSQKSTTQNDFLHLFCAF